MPASDMLQKISAVPQDVLVVSHDANVIAWCQNALAPMFRVVTHERRNSIVSAIREHAPDAVLLDAGDALCAFSVLEELRAVGEQVPVMIRMAAPTSTERSIARRSRAMVVTTRDPANTVAAYMTELLRVRRSGDTRRNEAVERLCATSRLTPAEYETLLVYLDLGDRKHLARRLGIAETSVRSRVRRLCRKLEIRHLHDVYRLLFEAAIAA